MIEVHRLTPILQNELAGCGARRKVIRLLADHFLDFRRQGSPSQSARQNGGRRGNQKPLLSKIFNKGFDCRRLTLRALSLKRMGDHLFQTLYSLFQVAQFLFQLYRAHLFLRQSDL